MAKFTVRFKDEVLTQLETDGPKVRIGRAEECELRIDNLGVSRTHAVLENLGGFWVVRDQESQNGVFVNGQKALTRVLNDGDVLAFGKYEVHVATALPGSSDGGGGGGLRDSGEAGLDATMALTPIAARGATGRLGSVKGYLEVEGARPVQLENAITTVGKDPGCDLVVGGLFAPRVLAVLVRDDRGFLLQSCGRTHTAVMVNGLPVALNVRLADGAAIRFAGKVKAVFRSGRPTA